MSNEHNENERDTENRKKTGSRDGSHHKSESKKKGWWDSGVVGYGAAPHWWINV